jgi:hypothetical protein
LKPAENPAMAGPSVKKAIYERTPIIDEFDINAIENFSVSQNDTVSEMMWQKF